ncbi:MAG: tyrosine--tRNA ligase [Candidatus Aenigmatarchaeota archaeon]
MKSATIAHLGSGLLRAIKLQDLLDAGIRFKFLVADWFAWINNKMGGDLEKIKNTGKYLIEAWKACGADLKKAEIVWTSDVVKDPEYWKKVISIAKATTIERMIRCSTIMGRREAEMQYTAQLFYPAMQAADPFYLEVDICQLGMDQRKATILSHELGPKLGWWSPVCVHHHLLIGLQGPTRMGKFEENISLDIQISSKMAKSIPKTCIFIHDTPEEIRKKILGAFCPEKEIKNNPILEICKYIIFRKKKTIEIERRIGTIEFHSYEELEKSFRAGELHPLDLKNTVAEEIIKILDPVRRYFEKNREAKELLEFVRAQQITR